MRLLSQLPFVFILLISTWVQSGCAHRRAISGQVIDRNGQPMDRVLVRLDPGNVEVITDSEGFYRIDYLRDDRGNRIPIDRKLEYRIEAFRLGFHIHESNLFYKRGQLILDPLTLTEDTIRIQPNQLSIDPAAYPDRTQSTGATYEGE